MNELPTQALHPKIRVVWVLGAMLAATVLTVAAFVVASTLNVPAVVPALLSLAFYAVAIGYPQVAYRRWRFEIREGDVFISKGVVFHTLALMPFDRIQFVETKQGPLDRSFGLTQLVIRTAGGEVSIPGLKEQDATRLRERLSAVVGTLSV